MHDYFRHITSLHLDRTTPIIRALFGQFISLELPCFNGHTYIQVDDRIHAEWSIVRLRLIKFAEDFGLPAQADENDVDGNKRGVATHHEVHWKDMTTRQVLATLAHHFGTYDDTSLQDVFEDNDFFGKVSIQQVLPVAWCLNDGHNLFAAYDQGCIQFDPDSIERWQAPRRPTRPWDNSSPAAPRKWRLTRALYAALSRCEMEAAFDTAIRALQSLVATIEDKRVRANIRRLIAEQAAHTPPK